MDGSDGSADLDTLLGRTNGTSMQPSNQNTTSSSAPASAPSGWQEFRAAMGRANDYYGSKAGAFDAGIEDSPALAVQQIGNAYYGLKNYFGLSKPEEYKQDITDLNNFTNKIRRTTYDSDRAADAKANPGFYKTGSQIGAMTQEMLLGQGVGSLVGKAAAPITTVLAPTTNVISSALASALPSYVPYLAKGAAQGAGQLGALTALQSDPGQMKGGLIKGVAMGAGLGALGGTASYLANSAFAGTSSAETQTLLNNATEVKNNTGLQATLGQATGNRDLQRAEAKSSSFSDVLQKQKDVITDRTEEVLNKHGFSGNSLKPEFIGNQYFGEDKADVLQGYQNALRQARDEATYHYDNVLNKMDSSTTVSPNELQGSVAATNFSNKIENGDPTLPLKGSDAANIVQDWSKRLNNQMITAPSQVHELRSQLGKDIDSLAKAGDSKTTGAIGPLKAIQDNLSNDMDSFAQKSGLTDEYRQAGQNYANTVVPMKQLGIDLDKGQSQFNVLTKAMMDPTQSEMAQKIYNQLPPDVQQGVKRSLIGDAALQATNMKTRTFDDLAFIKNYDALAKKGNIVLSAEDIQDAKNLTSMINITHDINKNTAMAQKAEEGLSALEPKNLISGRMWQGKMYTGLKYLTSTPTGQQILSQMADKVIPGSVEAQYAANALLSIGAGATKFGIAKSLAQSKGLVPPTNSAAAESLNPVQSSSPQEDGAASIDQLLGRH